MENATIKDLAYLIREAKDKNQPKPIFFLGAGASKTGNIPLAGEIVTDILAKYSTNPKIARLPDTDRIYPNLMNCLTASELNGLLR